MKVIRVTDLTERPLFGLVPQLADLIALHQGDLFSPVGDKRYDLIVTNPPYVATKVIAATLRDLLKPA